MHIIHPKYRADIDGLRAIAVLLVIGFHAFPAHVKAGFIGVDVFFVISGFLISTIIFHSLELQRFSLLEFYNRRIRRILPALITVLITSLLLGWFVLLPSEYRQLGKHVAAGSGFISNLVLWRETGYFDIAAHKKLLLHLWSLAIEEQFYIFWPLLLLCTWRRRWNFLPVSLAIGALSFAANLLLIGPHPSSAFYLPVTRVWELMIGGVLAYLCIHHKGFLSKYPDLQSAAGFGLLLTATVVITPGTSFPGLGALLPTFGTFWIIAAGPESWLNKRILSNRLLVAVGLISYPLYLWHWPLLVFAKLMHRADLALGVSWLTVTLAFFLSWLTYLLVEKPFRFGGNDRIKASALLVVLLFLGTAGGCLFWAKSVRTNTVFLPTLDDKAFAWGKEKQVNAAGRSKVSIKKLDYCLASGSEEPTVALIGDSHANAIFDAVNTEVTREGGSLIMLGKGGCPALLGVERGSMGCVPLMEQIVRYIEDNDRIQEVLIAGRFSSTFSGTDFGGGKTGNFYPIELAGAPAVRDRQTIFESGLGALVSRLTSKNKHVTVVLDCPELDFDPETCARVDAKCTIAYDRVRERQQPYSRSIRKLKDLYQFSVVDLKDVFCKADVCSAKEDSKVLYRDQHHLGFYGNQYIEKSGFSFLGMNSAMPAGGME